MAGGKENGVNGLVKDVKGTHLQGTMGILAKKQWVSCRCFPFNQLSDERQTNMGFVCLLASRTHRALSDPLVTHLQLCSPPDEA